MVAGGLVLTYLSQGWMAASFSHYILIQFLSDDDGSPSMDSVFFIMT